jgi:PKD repeat protein
MKYKKFYANLLLMTVIVSTLVFPMVLDNGNEGLLSSISRSDGLNMGSDESVEDVLPQENDNDDNTELNSPIASSGNSKWTFMVYLDADNNLESAGIDDLNEMEMVGSSSEVEIVVQMDRVSGYDVSNGGWTETKRYHVSKDADAYTIGTAVSSLGELNMGQSQTLSDFINWSQTNYPADNYALILWDHGSGPMYGPTAGGICWDDTNGHDYLTETEIKTAITGKGIDILGMDACLMASTEFWYALNSEVEYLVGSEKVEPGDGWPYNDILQWLTLNPSATAAQLSTIIVQKYMGSYSTAYQVTQSAADASALSSVVSALNTLSNAMIAQIGTYSNAINNSRTAAIEYDGYPYIDLYDFTDEIETQIPALSTQTAALKTAITTAIIENGYSPVLSGSHGLSIYFPKAQSGFSNVYRTNAFAGASTWDEFLLTYYSAPIDDDQFEENDASSSSAEIYSGFYPNLISKDDDYYNISVEADAHVSISITFTHITGVNDFDLYLWAQNGSLISGVDSKTNQESIYWVANTAQEIMIRVRNIGSGTMILYNFSVYIPIDDDIYEENDQASFATNINSQLNTTIPDLVAIDSDWYYFDASDNALVTVKLDYIAAKGYLTLLVYQKDGIYLDLLASVGTAADNEIYYFGVENNPPSSETYYIKIDNFENNTAYNLSVNTDLGADDMYDPLSGNDNDFINSPAVPLLSEGVYNNLVCIDKDFYNITLTAGQWLNISIYFENDDGDLDIYLYEPHSLTSIASSWYWEDNEELIFYCNYTATYSIKIHPYEINLKYNMTLNTSQVFYNDVYDGNNELWDQRANFPQISMGVRYTNLSAWDEDWYAINLTAGSSLVVAIWFNNSFGVLYLRLYNSFHTLVSNSFSSDPNEYIDYTVPSSGVYYVNILPFQQMAGYDLHVFTQPQVSFNIAAISNLTLQFSQSITGFVYTQSYFWDFGDGSSITETTGTTAHVYSSPGNYTATLTITSNYGAEYTGSQPTNAWGSPSNFSISLNGTNPINQTSFIVHWGLLLNAQNLTLYSPQVNSTNTSTSQVIITNMNANHISVNLTVTESDTYYFFCTYTNPLGIAYSNVIVVVVSLPGSGTGNGLSYPDWYLYAAIGGVAAVAIAYVLKPKNKKKKKTQKPKPSVEIKII